MNMKLTWKNLKKSNNKVTIFLKFFKPCNYRMVGQIHESHNAINRNQPVWTVLQMHFIIMVSSIKYASKPVFLCK